MKDTIGKFLQRKVVVLHQGDTLADAAKAMCANNVGCVVIASRQHRITGLLTDRDIVCHLVESQAGLETPISEAMTGPAVVADEESGVEDIVTLMKQNGVRRIPVVSITEGGAQKCVGLISLDDLLTDRALTVEDAAEILQPQLTHEVNVRVTDRDERAASRKNQTLTRFNTRLAQAVGLNRTTVNRLTEVLLGNVLRRIHFGEAKDFISQLPHKWQEEFLDLPAGPDRDITARTLLKDVCELLDCAPEEGTRIIRAFWEALSGLISEGELLQVASQLPKDMEELILGDHVAELQRYRQRGSVIHETIDSL